MILVQAEFEAREQEIERYFSFLKDFSASHITFLPSATLCNSGDQTELLKTLKANGFLLLYNLVESTLKNAIEAIFHEFRNRRVSFDHCTKKVRTLVLKNLKRRNVQDIVANLSSISTDVLVETFRKEELFAGNVDGRFVRDLAKAYGFAAPNLRSDELLTVKSSRNDLAHGVKSFSEVGRDYDLPRLDQIRGEVIAFLRALLQSVADYINQQHYLAARVGA